MINFAQKSIETWLKRKSLKKSQKVSPNRIADHLLGAIVLLSKMERAMISSVLTSTSVKGVDRVGMAAATALRAASGVAPLANQKLNETDVEGEGGRPSRIFKT